MEIAYQTPKLSQIHIGFRYERKNHDNTWTKTEFTTKDNLAYFEICLNDGTFRVKPLDHDDIKEAGWEEEKTMLPNKYSINKRSDIVLTLKKNGVVHIYHEWAENDRTIFKGEVKNYNKLLDVMEMVGINGCQE
jgi:hypothetical protein